MSWMKRGQLGPGGQPHAAPQAQAFGNQQSMYPNCQAGSNTAPPQTPQGQQFWQAPAQPPAPQPLQQYSHAQQYQPYPQDYPANANQYQPPQTQTHYNHNYANQYVNPPQNYQQNFYQNQPQQNYTQNAANTGTSNADGWEDNWDWGWEESAKKAQSMHNSTQQPPVQQQVFNNANVIEESFASTDSWNWAMDERKESKGPTGAPPKQESNELPSHQTVQRPPVGNNAASEPAPDNVNNQQAEEIKTLSDREVIKERLPNLALGKRFHLENLTPQWSIESQMSQESSDGPHTLSEGTYRSENQSRNSGESPVPNTDNSNFNYAQTALDETQNSEWSKNSDEPTVADSVNNISRRESHEELSNSLREMSIGNEHHSTNSSSQAPLIEPTSIQENLAAQPPLSILPATLPPPVSGVAPGPSSSMPPPPPATSALSQGPPQVTPLSRPPSSAHSAPVQANLPQPPLTSSPATLPPLIPPQSNSQNPFQRAGPFSHKSNTKSSSAQSFQPANLTSPAVVNKVSQNRAPVGFEANLETTPDNSERPDQPPVLFRPSPVPQSIPDNMEVAPQNDRNEYLQTAHLSSGDYSENTDFTRNLPPPGLRRMVVGQQESEYQNLNISGDEPPPGLARMVPGQQTEGDNPYSQPGDSYMDRHIDGQPMESAASARPFRQADGQQNPDAYPQPVPNRARESERRAVGAVGFDRMVPGEPSNAEYPQYQGSNYASNEQRVVTGVDRDFPIHIEASPSDVREQNMDGSDYMEPLRNVIGAREAVNEVTQDFSAPDETQREVTMEGENLQDLSVISSADLTYSREQLDGADQNLTDVGTDRNDASDSLDRPAASSRKQSLIRVHSSGDDSERDRAFKASPRRDRHRSSRDRDRDKNRDRNKEGRYSRGDRKYDRDDRPRDDKRTDKDRRDRDRGREADASPDARKLRRSTRSRKYDEDDTDYYSDRERDRRRYREGSYLSKPPRGEERRHDERRYHGERDRRERRDRDRDRYERHYADYRDIDPSRKYGNLHREREDERRRVTFSTDAKSNDNRSEGDTLSSTSRAESGEAGGTDEEGGARRGGRRRAPPRPDLYYDGYASYGEPYAAAQRQQYSYYEQLRLTDPAAYMLLYKQLMAGRAPPAHLRHTHYLPPEGYGAYEAPERGSVHSGRSSATPLKGNDTELTTDVSLGLQLEESTARSERMTPFRFATAHVKGSISGDKIVLVPAAYPADGRPATVRLLCAAAALAADPAAADLQRAPGPLVKGVTHKKSVIEYCLARVRAARVEGARDVIGYVLLWDLLALMLRQNGVVVGSDIAELLVRNCAEYECSPPPSPPPSPSPPPAPHDPPAPGEDSLSPAAALAQFRDHLLVGNREEALETAMRAGLWAHALALGAVGGRRARAHVQARFLHAQPRTDPLHTLYAALAHAPVPAAEVCAGRGGEWRAHAAVLLANPAARAEHSAAALTALGDRLMSRGLVYSAQFVYVSCGVEVARHPLAPLGAGVGAPVPRLALLLAEPRAATLHQLAHPRAILATEVLEYARSLAAHGEYAMDELQPYKLVAAVRLVDAGQAARALAYAEVAARAVARRPHAHAPALVRQLARLAHRLRHYEPDDVADDGDSAEGSPTHQQWLHDVTQLADTLQTSQSHLQPEQGGDRSQQYQSAPTGSSPAHLYAPPPDTTHSAEHPPYTAQSTDRSAYTAQGADLSPYAALNLDQSRAYTGQNADQAGAYTNQNADQSAVYTGQSTDQSGAYTGQSLDQSAYTGQSTEQPAYTGQIAEQSGPYTGQSAEQSGPYASQSAEEADRSNYHYEDWSRTEETHSQSYGDPYWQPYGESGEDAARPTISMPGAARAGRGRDASPEREVSERSPEPTAEGRGGAESRSGAEGRGGAEGRTRTGGGSWIGGILTKLSLRPPNQMILPDDKNPTIVWDAQEKRWRDVAGGEESAPAPPPPPPHRPPTTASPPPGAPGTPATPGAPVANIFKMQKSRHIKKSYVDVFNPRGDAPPRARPADAAPPAPPPAPLAPPPNNYFVPSAEGMYEYDASRTGDDDQYSRSGI